MASPQASDGIFCNQKIEMTEADADYTTAAVVTLTAKDMKNYGEFSVIAMTSVLGGSGIEVVEIVAGSDSAVTSDITVIKTSGTVAADAVLDYVAVSCTAEEIAQEAADAGAALRYVACRLEMHHAGDEAVITTIRSKPRFPADGLTATTIA